MRYFFQQCPNPNSNSFQTWQCTTTKNLVEFTQTGSVNNRSLIFQIDNYLIDNKLPFLAN